MRKVRGLLRESPGADPSKRLEGSQTLENGSALDSTEKSLSSLVAPCNSSALLERHVSGGWLWRKHDYWGIFDYPQSGDWLPRRSSVWFHVVQRWSHREGPGALYWSSSQGIDLTPYNVSLNLLFHFQLFLYLFFACSCATSSQSGKQLYERKAWASLRTLGWYSWLTSHVATGDTLPKWKLTGNDCCSATKWINKLSMGNSRWIENLPLNWHRWWRKLTLESTTMRRSEPVGRAATIGSSPRRWINSFPSDIVPTSPLISTS